MIAQAEASNVALTFADRLTVENLCRCQRTIRKSSRPQSGQLAQARAYASELGLTPTGRTRVAARKAKEADGATPAKGGAALARERALQARRAAGGSGCAVVFLRLRTVTRGM